MKNSFSQALPVSKIFIVAFVAVISLLVSFIIASVVAIPFFGLDSISEIIGPNADYSDRNVSFLKFMQIVQSVGLFIIPSIVVAYLFSESAWDYLKLKRVPFLYSILLSALIIFLSNPLINFAADVNSKLSLPTVLNGLETWMKDLEQSAARLTKLFLLAHSTGELFFNIFLIALIPAIGEEFLFRGVIQRLFKEWTKNDHLAVWISAGLFSALHFQFYGFLPRAILGAMFGYLFVISKNLWLPVISHFLNNAVAVIAYYLYGEGVLNVDPEKIGANTKYQIAAISSFLIIIFLFWLVYKHERTKNQKFKVA